MQALRVGRTLPRTVTKHLMFDNYDMPSGVDNLLTLRGLQSACL